ncbi:hypothetical protein Smp_153240 [Schistosoma mansoni]|uniref:hypothetical protein n=1 Tax=Schistosoma mansoni TaxID=6183 RepID=UPI0001A637D6|nr:hypothetical protein Smp_153240 [Schistosoma mansoni]|eukprot:XP_018653801.1 hypothetical protein Smp_153240 [Schistosoma mansoni]
MITKRKLTYLAYLVSLFVYLSNGQKSCPAVNYITPTEASTEGGSAIMIFGCGFEQSAFVLPGSNSNSGNRVFLRSAWQTYKAELVEEGGNMIKFSSPYGIGLLSPTSDKGYIMCKRSVSHTGSVNISFIVDAPYGRSKTLESVYRVDRNEQTFMHQSYSGNRGLTVQFWSDLKASSVSDLLMIDFDQITNTTLKEAYLYEPEFIPKDLFNGTGIIRLSMIFVPPKNSYYQFIVTSANTYALLGGRINETLVIDHSALVNSSIVPIAEIQTVSIPTAATQYKLCLFNSCTLPLPVQNPNVDLINEEISEKLNGSTVKTKIVQTTNDYLILEITFPQEFGDIPLLNLQSFPETINKPQVNETVQGMTGFSNTIRPSYGGMYSYMTYTLASTENEIRQAYLNLGSSWCPSKLINPTFKYAVLDDFETSTLNTVTTETVAFCGRQSTFNLFTYQFAQLISVNTNPYLCFAIKGKTENSVNFLYNAIGVTSRLLKQTLTYSIDLTLKDENSWKFKCINVLQLLRTDPRNINATIFQLESFAIPPRKKFYELEYSLFLDTVYMGTKPISDNPDGKL